MNTATPIRRRRFEFRPTLWPTLVAAPALLVLIGLGVWQLERLAWKRTLIATIEARLEAPAVALPAEVRDPEAWGYRRVVVRGRFLHDREIHLFAHDRRGQLGYFVVTPLRRADGGFVLVNRGWVPAARKDPATRPAGQVEGPVEIEGIVRLPWRQGWFVPDNDPAENVWFWGDLEGMAAAAGIAAPALLVDAGPAPNPGGLPVGGQTKVRFRNDHLGYALTWFGLAAGLAVVYVLYHLRREASGPGK